MSTRYHPNNGLDSGGYGADGEALEPATLWFILICDLVS
jgi:hypothetical protein